MRLSPGWFAAMAVAIWAASTTAAAQQATDFLADNGPRPRTVARTVVIQPILGDPLASGSLLRNAYAAVADATPAFPVLLKLEPGTYDIGSTPFTLDKNDVHLEGSGRDASIVKGTGFVVLLTQANLTASRFSVMNPSGDGIRALSGRLEVTSMRITSIRNDASSFAIGLQYAFGAYGSTKDVEIEVANASGHALGASISSSDPSTFLMDRVVVRASGGGSIRAVEVGSSVRLQNVDVESTLIGLSILANGPMPHLVAIVNSRIVAGSTGLATISNGASTVTIQGSSIIGSPLSIDLGSISAATVRVADSLLSGQVRVFPPNTIICQGAYDASFQPRNAACQ